MQAGWRLDSVGLHGSPSDGETSALAEVAVKARAQGSGGVLVRKASFPDEEDGGEEHETAIEKDRGT